MKKGTDVVIVAAARTAIGRFGGALKDVRAHKLAAHVIQEVLRRVGRLDAGRIDDVIFGECVQCPDEANTARTAALEVAPDALCLADHPVSRGGVFGENEGGAATC